MEDRTQVAGEVAQRTLETLTHAQPQLTSMSQSRTPTPVWKQSWLKIDSRGNPRLQDLEVKASAFCEAFAVNPRRGYRLLITGPNGTGKTHTARAVIRWARSEKMRIPVDPIQIDDGETYDLVRSMFLFWPKVVDGFKAGHWNVIEEAEKQSMLAIDDIGAEHDPSGIGREKLCYLLERRAQRYTIMTTNVPRLEWQEKFERRIASRFLRNCVIVDLSGLPDFCAL
jgi:DNA replication protein DnaC